MRKLVLGAIATMMVPGAASAQAIVNGSFELGTDPGSFTNVPTGGTAIAGWTVGGAGVDYVGSYWQAAQGSRSIDLSGTNKGSISQLVTGLTIGQMYAVSFALAGNPDGGSATKVAIASDGGNYGGVFYFAQGSNDTVNMGWTQQRFDFIANATVANLTFSATEFDAFGPALDNVSIAAVPEPATWGMMIVGFGVVGAGLRSQRRKVAVAYA